MAVDGDTCGFDLPVGDVAFQGLDAVVTERHVGAAAGNTTLFGVVLLAVLDLCGEST